ncbi:MAG: integrase [Gammaproteobacteria bacterium]|nr:integrase [Gammaproteobacteria bacterium]
MSYPQNLTMLNDTMIRTIKPGQKPQKLFDTGGLYLLLQPNDARYWRLKYRLHGIEKTLSLGVYPEVSLKQARERREKLRQQIANDIDPSGARKAEKRADAQSFKSVALEWHQQRVATWSKGYATQLMHRMNKNLFPWIGSKPIAKMTAADFLDCLQRIEKRGAVEMAHRARGTCSDVMRFAVATRRAERDPTVDLRGAIAPTKRKHLASIKDPKGIGDLMRAIDGYVGRSEVVNAAVRLIPLVFTRTCEMRKAEWSEFDLDNAQWKVPPERMKRRFPQIVPLSTQAIKILRDLLPITGPNGLVFPSIRSGSRPISDGTINAALRMMGYTGDHMTGHGFRSMASTILNEQGWHPDAIERQLSHAEKNTVRGIYNYAEYLPIRREMMQAWADYLDALRKNKPFQIVAMGKAA